MRPSSSGIGALAARLIRRVNPELCILCQSKTTKGLQKGPGSGKRIREVAEKKKDEVNKRIKLLPPDTVLKYHNTSKCYKGYTKHERKSEQEESEPPEKQVEEMDTSDNVTPRAKRERNPRTARSAPSPKLPASKLACTVCGSPRLYIPGRRTFTREKFRICEPDSANAFLSSLKGDPSSACAIRCSDLKTVNDVYAADVYCHEKCYNDLTYNYVKKPKLGSCDDSSKIMVDVFNSVLPVIDSLIQSGYGIAVSEVKDMLSEKDPSLCVTNKHARKLLVDHYGDEIRFCPSHRKNESDLVFSVDVTLDDVAKCLRNRNACQTAGEILSEAFDKVDFNLADKFCDANEIRQSWLNTCMPDDFLTLLSALFKIPRSRLLDIKLIDMSDLLDMKENPTTSDVGQEDENDVSENDLLSDIEWAAKNQQLQLSCIFQTMFYIKYHGTKPTPLAAANGQFVYNKHKSKEMLSMLNKMGVSEGYAKVRSRRKNLALYQVALSSENEVPIPSTFEKGVFCTAALDNSDFGDQSSISGMESNHVTSINLYQEIKGEAGSKPNVSSMNLEQYAVPDMLPCQKVPPFPKPLVKPNLPPSFKAADKSESILDTQSALREAKFTEFMLSYLRCAKLNRRINDEDHDDDSDEGDADGNHDDEEDMPRRIPDANENLLIPTWHGAHALVSTANVPMMRVSFAPMIPFPVTNYETVRKAMQNLQSFRRQVNPNQSVLPAGSDEGVYHTFADIQIDEWETFNDLHGLIGNFHLTKVVSKCGGRFIRGSGLDQALTEEKIFGKNTLNQALEGNHYVRAVCLILLISDLISALSFDSFQHWYAIRKDLDGLSPDITDSVTYVRQLFSDKKRCPTEFHELRSICGQLYEDYQEFTKECVSKSEICEYTEQFQEIANLNKFAVSSDREGNFALHIGTVEESLPVFRENDCVNYFRYGNWYIQSTYDLEKRAPAVFNKLNEGLFVVKDKEGFFNAVAKDMKLEQTNQRSQKSEGGCVGQVRNLVFMLEWLLAFNEVVDVGSVFRDLMREKSMEHSEFNPGAIHHELMGSKALSFNKNLVKLLNLISSKGNPYSVWSDNNLIAPVKMQNLMTRTLIDGDIVQRYLHLMENGKKHTEQFIKERFQLKTKKLGHTITRRSLPRMDYKPKHSCVLVPITVTSKMLAAGQRSIDIARERGMKSEEIYRHDFLPTSSLFDGKLPKKVNSKSELVTQLEKLAELSEEDMRKPEGEVVIIVDLMSRLRSCPSKSAKTFGQLIENALAFPEFEYSRIHVVRDSYIEDSTKSAERARRAGGKEVVEYEEGQISEDVPLPSDMESFWPSESNKVQLQSFTKDHTAENILQEKDVTVSGIITDSDIYPTEHFSAGRRTSTEIDYLKAPIEEADDRIIRHAFYEVQQGSKRILVVSNDADTIARLLYFMKKYKERGLTHIWVMYGTGDNKRYEPLHTIYHRLSIRLSRVVVKAHILTGDDGLSKIGTKLAALCHDPVKYLSSFGESEEICDADLWLVEEYLAKVWDGANSSNVFRTFSQLRLHEYTSPKNAKPLDQLAPTSSSISGHIIRAHAAIRDVVTLLDDDYQRSDPLKNKWIRESGVLIPDMCLNPLPEKKLVTCKCQGKCTSKKCKCHEATEICTAFCHGKKSVCVNRF